MITDRRDPTALGEALLSARASFPDTPLSVIYDRSYFAVPDHKSDPTPIEKYGDPRVLPSTLPN